jgi:TIR domain-containing protein
MPVAEGGGIFVSYRRQESSHLAGRVADRLADRFGESQVFIDVDTIEPGVDFAEEIRRAVAACTVLVAIIGSAWLTATDERGRRRLDDPDDLVRLEIEAALARDVRVIPILVEGAVMPGRDDLPESLAGLARRNALLIRHESFRSDAGRLVSAIERVLAAAPGTATVPRGFDAPSVQPAGNAVGEVAQQGSGPARNDPARAARLLTDAEHIANSIIDQPSKARALSAVAAALAATDPDHAAQMFTDAEHIARSITDEYFKAQALSDVAAALAATDPDRAERLAHAITEEAWKAWALSAIAAALAATDPDRAVRIARSLTFEPAKASALSGVAEAMAATDPDRAESIAHSLIDESSKVTALCGIATALASTSSA